MKKETLIKLMECEQVTAINTDAKTIEVLAGASEGLSNVLTALKDEDDFEGWTISIMPLTPNIEEMNRSLMESVTNTIGFGLLRKILRSGKKQK